MDPETGWERYGGMQKCPSYGRKDKQANGWAESELSEGCVSVCQPTSYSKSSQRARMGEHGSVGN